METCRIVRIEGSGLYLYHKDVCWGGHFRVVHSVKGETNFEGFSLSCGITPQFTPKGELTFPNSHTPVKLL